MRISTKVRKVFIFSLLCAAAMTVACQAATVTLGGNVSVKVSGVFTLSIDTSSVDFGSSRPGDWKEVPSTSGYADAVVCKSNTGSAWYLKIKASGPLSSGSNSIPLANFGWMSSYAGSKNTPYNNLSSGLTHQPAEGYQAFTGSDQGVYTSGPADNNSMPNGTEVQFKYSVQVPDNPSQLAGTYTTTVTYTMTE
ncbi:MAG: hypothetical protein NTZ10_06100 [Candidatus Saganbacteria bacterium]|nr:hypothetical protein [Candidatus Saganbacteria bacterium]